MAYAESPLLNHYPILANLASCPPFVEALVDDWWLEAVAPWLLIPDLTPTNMESLWATFESMLGHEFPTHIAAILAPVQGLSHEAELNRLTSLKIAVLTVAIGSGLGNANYQVSPSFGGDITVQREAKLPGTETRKFKVGKIRSVNWRTSPSTLSKFLSDVSSGWVSATALTFNPFLGLPADELEKHFSLWNSLSELRKANLELPYGLCPRTEHFLQLEHLGYIPRYKPEDLKPYGITPETAGKISTIWAHTSVRGSRLKTNSNLIPQTPNSDLLLRRALSLMEGHANWTA